MKRKLRLVLCLFTLVLFNLVPSAEEVAVRSGECRDCGVMACSFNTDCDPGCRCYKGRYEIDGVCVPRD